MTAQEGSALATRRSFDTLVARASALRTSVDEVDILRETHWQLGQDARLREDLRFRPTPWHRWVLSEAFVANDAVVSQMRREHRAPLDIESTLAALDVVVRRRCVVCPADPRIVVEGGSVRLSARELTDQPLVEAAVTDLERYVTHLPLHSLKAAAASEPEGRWGRRAQEEVIETLGWVRVAPRGLRLNARMFVARIEGGSMDDGKSGLVDGGYAVFELWPTGSKQGLDVLVRGAFRDPETGSYAVKRYLADPRDESGRHRRISLVSLNNDKERFPDIQLTPADDDEVTVVASVLRSLSLDEFSRAPKPVRRRGRRDISSPAAHEEIAARLGEHVDGFFANTSGTTSVEGHGPQIAKWRAEVVCLDAEAGGLHLEVGPLPGLWSFVKRLSVVGTDWVSSVLGSNVRHRASRMPVPPSSGPWTWVAAGFEDDPEVDFSKLSVPALASDRALVFHVDAEGVGRAIRTFALSPGQRYRVLVPGALLDGGADEEQLDPAGGDWRLWEVDLPMNPASTQLEFAKRLGLEIGRPAPRIGWVLKSPVAWRANDRGQGYACFLADSAPVAELSEGHVEADGEAAAFVRGPKGVVTVNLPAGERQLLRLENLEPGRYVLMVAHDRTAIDSPKIPFEILDAPEPTPRAEARFSSGTEVLLARPGESVISGPRDLSAPEASSFLEDALIEGPPGWPMRVVWIELDEQILVRTAVDDDGRLEGSAIVPAVRERVARRPVGDVVFDFAELGRIVFRHERRSEPATLRARFADLLSTKGANVERLAGDFVVLGPMWFEPVVAALGFDVEDIPDESLPERPCQVRASRLLHVERRGVKIERRAARVLVLTEHLAPSLSAELYSWVDQVCAGEEVRDALISDGIRWAAHRRGSRLDRRVWDLASVVNDPDEFLSFLRAAAEGI